MHFRIELECWHAILTSNFFFFFFLPHSKNIIFYHNSSMIMASMHKYTKVCFICRVYYSLFIIVIDMVLHSRSVSHKKYEHIRPLPQNRIDGGQPMWFYLNSKHFFKLTSGRKSWFEHHIITTNPHDNLSFSRFVFFANGRFSFVSISEMPSFNSLSHSRQTSMNQKKISLSIWVLIRNGRSNGQQIGLNVINNKLM